MVIQSLSIINRFSLVETKRTNSFSHFMLLATHTGVCVQLLDHYGQVASAQSNYNGRTVFNMTGMCTGGWLGDCCGDANTAYMS